MIDIHCHILPMVDDGSDSVETSLEMLDAAWQDGTDALILTPHYALEYGFDNPQEKIRALFAQFSDIVRQEGIPVRLYLGCEFLYSDAQSFAEHFEDITLLNHTAHQLMEFYFDVEARDVLDAIDAVKAAGRIPVIAHPERYECVQSEAGLAEAMVNKGALLQMNKGSLFRRYGEYAQDTVMELLARHYITFVGSDAHHIRYRTPLMGDAYDLVSEQFGRSYAEAIFRINAEQLLGIRI